MLNHYLKYLKKLVKLVKDISRTISCRSIHQVKKKRTKKGTNLETQCPETVVFIWPDYHPLFRVECELHFIRFSLDIAADGKTLPSDVVVDQSLQSQIPPRSGVEHVSFDLLEMSRYFVQYIIGKRKIRVFNIPLSYDNIIILIIYFIIIGFSWDSCIWLLYMMIQIWSFDRILSWMDCSFAMLIRFISYTNEILQWIIGTRSLPEALPARGSRAANQTGKFCIFIWLGLEYLWIWSMNGDLGDSKWSWIMK